MTLNAFAAEKRLQIFADLKAGLDPREGDFDPAVLREGRIKGAPRVGTTNYAPDTIHFEFIFPDPKSSATIFTVRLTSPHRIVFLPVPEWVIESIWQGDIDGSYHFEPDALALVERYQKELEPAANATWFGPREAKRRE